MGARQKQRGNEVNMHFTYCSHCGTKLIPKEIGDEGEIPFCINCNIPLWDMFTTCIIAAVVNENGEIALLRQNYVSATKYVCVAGIMKMGESAEETVIREVKEEIGQNVEKLEFIRSYPYEKKEMLMLGYQACVKKQEFQLSGEVDSAEWVRYENALSLLREGSIAWQLVKTIIENENHKKKDMEYLFETEHLRIRKFEIEDAGCLYENHLEEEVKRWIPNESYVDMEETQGAIRFYADCVNDKHLPYVLAVELKETGELIGDTGVNEVEGNCNEVEIGYGICKKYSGNGYATELLKAMTEFITRTFGINILFGRVMRGNHASVRVLEKNGFAFVKEEFGAKDDPYGNGMLIYKKEWETGQES